MTSTIATESSADFAKISPTAKFVAYYRQFSDIPFATEIAEILQVEESAQQILGDPTVMESFMRRGAPAMEARYKCMIGAIKKRGIKQVLEFASGLSFRGLWMAEDPAVTYVETDLEGIMQEKFRVIASIPAMAERIAQSNVFFHTVNALNFDEIAVALEHFDPKKPIAVIHEGLFQYLSMAEKKSLAVNIKKILQSFAGGAWITPDLTNKEDQLDRFYHNKEQSEWVSQAIAKLTNRNFEDRNFESKAAVELFCADLGFNMEVSSQIDGSYQLTAASRFNLNEEEIRGLAGALQVWTLTL